MTNLWLLIKTSLLDSFPIINKLRKKRKSQALLLACILVYLLIFLGITIYMLMFAGLFKDANEPQLILMMGVVFGAVLIFFQTLSKANSFIFRTKDYNLLMTLPISLKTIVASKLISLYIFNFFFAFTIMLPIYIAYSIINGFNGVMFGIYLIVVILMPLFPTALSSLFAFLLGYIPLKPKVKNILSTILYLVFFILFFSFYMKSMDATEDEMMQGVADLYKTFGKVYFLSNMIFSTFYELNILNLLIYALISIGSITLFVILVSFFFKSFNNFTNRHIYNKNYEIKKEKYKTNGEIKTLFIKELRNYISLPSYIMNTIVGPIISIIMTIYLSLELEGLLEQVFESTNQLSEVSLMGIMSCLLIFLVTMISTSSSSISLEGKSFWILKSSPVKTKSVFISKMLLNILLTVPFVIIDILIAGVIMKVKWYVMILASLSPIVLSITFSILGLFFNILFPKFTYDNPLKVIKQGLPVGLNMCASLVVSLVVFILHLIIAMVLGDVLAFVLDTIFSVIILIISVILLKKIGTNKYERINA